MWKMCAYNQTQSKWTHQLNSREGNMVYANEYPRYSILHVCKQTRKKDKRVKEKGGRGEHLEKKKAYAERCVYFDIHFMDVDSRHFNNR